MHSLSGYSAHADQHDLIDFVTGIPSAPRELRLVHGDTGAKASLAEAPNRTGNTLYVRDHEAVLEQLG